jgi:hypothetical protein
MPGNGQCEEEAIKRRQHGNLTGAPSQFGIRRFRKVPDGIKAPAGTQSAADVSGFEGQDEDEDKRDRKEGRQPQQ